MTLELKQALDNTETTYSALVEIANGIVNDYVQAINELIDNAVVNVEKLSNEDIRLLLLKLSLKSYSFGDLKEKASLKADCAEALKEEKLAVEFNKTEGSVAVRTNLATLAISDAILTEMIYKLVASLLKTKLDEIHRVVDTLKTILVSRLSEAKLNGNMTNEDVGL